MHYFLPICIFSRIINPRLACAVVGTSSVLFVEALYFSNRERFPIFCNCDNHRVVKMTFTFCSVPMHTHVCVHHCLTILPVASAPTNLMAVQEGPTSIRVSWSPPTPLGDTTGYRIYYSGGSSGSVNVSDGSIDNYLLTGLQNGESYTISIVATSQHLPSDTLVINIPLCKSISL